VSNEKRNRFQDADSVKDSSGSGKVIGAEQLGQWGVELRQLKNKIGGRKRELWIDRVSLKLREVTEPYEMKPVLLIVGTFLGLFLGFLLSLTVIGFWIGLFIGGLLAAGVGLFLFRTLYWKSTQVVRECCKVGPSQIAELEKEYVEKSRDFEAARSAFLHQQSKNEADKANGESSMPQAEAPRENGTKRNSDPTSNKEESKSGQPASEDIPVLGGKWRTCSPAEFRGLVEKSFRQLGYKLQIPQNDSQLGVHLIAYHSAQRIVVKIVPEPIQVTQGAVQQVFSAKTHLECDSSLVITPGTFSLDARKLAKSTKTIMVGQIEMNRFLEGRVFPRILS